VSSRQEEKERRRRERLEREREETAAAERARRLRLAGGGVLAVAAVVAIAVVALAGGGGSSRSGQPKAATAAARPNVPPLPARKLTDAFAAAKAAGCVLNTYPSEGRTHVTTTIAYKTNPPTSGNHNPDAAADGDYSGQPTPAKENYVHTLEHGRIEVQYRPDASPVEVAQLQALLGENQGYHMLLLQNNTNMPYAVAATAWTHLLGCPTFNPSVFDALRTFRDRYQDQAPEQLR